MRTFRTTALCSLIAARFCLPPLPAWAGKPDGKLDVVWIDVEGGAATLIVTPAGQCVLIDAGSPGDRDAGRIIKAAQTAGCKKIDHMLVTHFHTDHFGGVADLAKGLPIGTLWDNGLSSAPEKERSEPLLEPYKALKVGKRATYKVGDAIPLAGVKGSPALSLRVLAARKDMVPPRTQQPNPACSDAKEKPEDTSDNANSAVFALDFGPFRFFDGGDLTWNIEGKLVCPNDRTGDVDVFQSDHHGLDVSNNPVLVKTLGPTVAVVNNGPRKGGEAGTIATLKATPSLQALYQVHKNMKPGADNTAAELIANEQGTRAGEIIKMAVAADGRSYDVEIPGTGHKRHFETRRRPLAVGAPAPALKTTAHDGSRVDLRALKGKDVVVYFYPKDDTPGCTKEACSIRDSWASLQKAGIRVFGVSTQGMDSHKAFAEKHKLPFPLLPDESGAIAESFGVALNNGLARRVTFLIGKDGTIKHVWDKVDVGKHADEILGAAAGS